MSFLDKTGLTQLWSKCKAHFAPKDHSHTASDVGAYTKAQVDSLLANAGGDVDLSGYLPLSGGVMTGSVTLEGATLNKPLVVSGGDSATAGKIIFGTNGQITNESTATLLGRIGESFYIGHSTYPVYIRGKNTRPYYNNANTTLALSSDIPTTLPASDVYSWAKASTKPTYSASEVGAVPTSRTVNGKPLSGNISLSASDVGAGKISYQHNSTSVSAMSVGELKLVGFFTSYGATQSVKLPSGGTYYVVGITESSDYNDDWFASGETGAVKSGGTTVTIYGYNPWLLVYRIS